MGRKRKVPIADEEKENEDSSGVGAGISGCGADSIVHHGPMYTIMSNVQLNETFHKKYLQEMKQLYAKMDHDAFIFTFVKMMKTAMEAEESNEFANTTLLFCAKFVSSYEGEEAHPVLVETFKWLLTTISNNPHIRFRLCQFVNMILNALGSEAALDDAICDRIMEYMQERLRDMSPSVRVQAVLAMQRLQVPDNPDDPVLRSYQFHLCSDPSPRVRQMVITCMGRNYHTIPYILDRLWDIDEKVRRHTYLHMSCYPVRSYKVSMRLTLLERGLNDRSEMVRKVVTTIMLQQWIESYQKDLILLVAALKLDSTDAELDRFRKITKQTLKAIFKRQNNNDLIACIPLEEDGQFHRCVPHDKLTMEIAIYWQCLTEYLQTEMAEELDQVVPELSTFCTYVERYCESQRPDMEKFELMDFQYRLLSLMEIVYTFDLGDEIGRGNLQKLLAHLLKNFYLDEKVIEVIVKCVENLITDENTRLQFFVEIIHEICDLNANQNVLQNDRNLISELLANSSNSDLNLKLSSLKVKILDLEEQETEFVQRKEYEKALQITEEKNAATEEYTNLLKPLLEKHAGTEVLNLPLAKVVSNESILKSLQITYFMVVSAKVSSLSPSVAKLYNDFICRHIASKQIATRDWALKCGTAYGMLCESLAKSMFDELYSQFFRNHYKRIWATSITCIFDLLDKYGVDNFVVQEHQNKSKKSGRQLYNTLEFLDIEEESNVDAAAGQGVDVIYLMSHFLNTCNDICIMSAIIKGFCRLILHGYIKNGDIIEKLLLCYFNPTTDPEINQILGGFLEILIERKKHSVLQPFILPTVSQVLNDNTLHEIRPETITRFYINATRQEACLSSKDIIHNKLALSFLHEMVNNVGSKELCKLLAKEMLTLELDVQQNIPLKNEMKNLTEKLIQSDFEPKTIKNIIDFKDMLDGNFNPTIRRTNFNESDEEQDDELHSNVAPPTIIEESEKDDENLTENDSESIAPPGDVVSEPNRSTAASINQSQPISESINHSQPTSITTSEDIPQSPTTTTYGRDNQVGHRYLRRSLNMSRTQSESESTDGRERPRKIRIEARIDSDKKSDQPPNEKRKANPISSGAKRNLRLREKTCVVVNDAPTAPESITDDNTLTNDNVAEADHEDQHPIGATTVEKTKSPTKKATNIRKKKQRNKSSESYDRNADNCETGGTTRRSLPSSASSLTPEKEPAELLSPSKRNVSAELSIRQTSINDALNLSDVIPASPTTDSPPRLQTTRLRRAANATLNSTTRRSTRSKTRDLTHSTKNSATTPMRNGRKRVLQMTPTATRSLLSKDIVVVISDESINSPIRKQLRTHIIESRSSSRRNALTSPAKPALDNPVPEPTESRTSTAEPDDAAVGPVPSPRPNNVIVAINKSLITTVISNVEVVSPDKLAQTSNSPKTRPLTNSAAPSLTNNSLRKSAEHKSKSNFALGPLSTTSTISTRNAKRQELRTKLIMTRKRLSSLEQNSSSSGGGAAVLSSVNTQPNPLKALRSKPRLQSKIPVKIARTTAGPRKVTTTSSSTNSESSSSSSGSSALSSGAEDIASGSIRFGFQRKKVLTSKMTCINLVHQPTGPVPMRLARPTRAAALTAAAALVRIREKPPLRRTNK